MDEPARIVTNGQTINISQVLTVNFNEKKKVARRRWAILAKALKSPADSEPSSPTDEYSVRRISSFMLFTTTQLEGAPTPAHEHFSKETLRRTWYRYSMSTGITADNTISSLNNTNSIKSNRINPSINHCNNSQQNALNSESLPEIYSVLIGHRRRTFSAEDLMGFNNTGNVCIWPSEETLSYFVGLNLTSFRGKSVLELGGGMSCLAGLICAKYACCTRVLLTDGNKTSVENVQVSVACNEFRSPVTCQILRWGTATGTVEGDLLQFDVILCADCLFFDEARADLIATLQACLTDGGVAYVMAPRRGTTLESFREQVAATRAFRCIVRERYCDVVWQKHLELREMEECSYNEDIHYPVLLELTKVC